MYLSIHSFRWLIFGLAIPRWFNGLPPDGLSDLIDSFNTVEEGCGRIVRRICRHTYIILKQAE